MVLPEDERRRRCRESKRRYLERKKVEKYGSDAAGVDMRGRHGRHANGESNGRYNPGRLVTSHGYVVVRVPKGHPHAFGPPGLSGAYTYKHIVVAMRYLGRPLASGETVHHKNGDRTDNRWRNLAVMSRSEHAREHAAHRDARDSRGRFRPGKRH